MTFYASRKRVFWTVLVLMLVVGLGLYSWLDKTITLVVDGHQFKVHTFKRTVAEVLAENNIRLGPADEVSPEPDHLVDDGMKVDVIRAFPVVIKAGGREKRVLTVPSRVGDILKKAGITPGPQDVVKPEADKILTAAGEIRVIQVTTEVIKENVVLPYQVERTSDPTLEKGLKRTVKQGKNGLARTTVRITLWDGKPVKREVVDREVIKQPVNQVVAMGTITSVSRGSLRFNFREARIMHSTAYTYTGRNTATGLRPAVGLVAVDPSVIPLGTRLYIEGYGFAKAADRGSSIQGDRLDVFLESLEECRRWGVRRVKVYILE